MSASINDASNDAIQFIVKHGDLTRSAAYDAIKLLTGNGFAVTRADLTPPAADYVAGLGLKRIVEEIDGAMKHGTWRDEHGMRLKDTPEWVAFYNSLAARPASPDTRVVTMEQLRAWLEMTETPAKFANETETIRAIIGGQDRG